MVDTAILDVHVANALAAQNAAHDAAAKTLRQVMTEQGWTEVAVECEGMSSIQRVRLATTGEWADIDEDLAEELWDVVGWIAKPKFKWVGGDFDYVLTLDRLDPSAAHL